MYYAKIENGQFVGRVNVADVVPDVTFTTEPTDEQLAPYGVVIVRDALSVPDYDPTTHGIADIDPTLGDDGKWYANYVVIERAPETPPPGSDV